MATPQLDNKHLTFGHVLNQPDIVKTRENLPANSHGRPASEVRIDNYRELARQMKYKSVKNVEERSESVSSNSNSEDVKKKKKKHRRKKHKKESKKEKRLRSEEKDDRTEKRDRKNNISSVLSDIRAVEVPHALPTNFSNRDRTEDRKYRKQEDSEDSEPINREITSLQKSRSNRTIFESSGRKLKGKGAINFKSRSRSPTPPYWKQEERRAIIPLKKAQNTEEKNINKRELVAAQNLDYKSVKKDSEGSIKKLSAFERERVDVEDSFDKGRQKWGNKGDANEDRERQSSADGRKDTKVERRQKMGIAKEVKDQSEDSENESGSGYEEGEIQNEKDEVLTSEKSRDTHNRRDSQLMKNDNMASGKKEESKSSRDYRNRDKSRQDIHGWRRVSYESQSSERNQNRRRDLYERRYSNSNRVDQNRDSKEVRYGYQEPKQSWNSDWMNNAKFRQEKDMRFQPMQSSEESKWNEKSSHFGSNSHSKDESLYQGQDMIGRNLRQQRRSRSGSSDMERLVKKMKPDVQNRFFSSVAPKYEHVNKRTEFKSFLQEKSDSPPPSHWKPGLKQLRNSSVAEKHKNSLDETSLSVLQKEKNSLNAQLATVSIDEVLPLPVPTTVTSSKIIYQLDSGFQIQYSVTSSDQPLAASLGDGKLVQEIPLNKSKAESSVPQSHFRSHLTSSTSRSRSRSSLSPGSDSSRSEPRLKDQTTKTNRLVRHRKKLRKLEQVQGKDNTEAARKAEESSISSLAIVLPSLEKVEMKTSEVVKQRNEDILPEPLPDRPISRSSSSSSSPRQRPKPSSSIDEKPISRCNSRSGSESPSHLRASLLEQIRNKEKAEKDRGASCYDEKVDAKKNRYECNKYETGQKNLDSKSAQDKCSVYEKRASKSSSSSPEPPPVIPRVHRSRFGVLLAGSVSLEDGESKANIVLKISNDESPSSAVIMHSSSEEPHPSETILKQEPSSTAIHYPNIPVKEELISSVKDVPLPSDPQVPLSKSHLSLIVTPSSQPSVTTTSLPPTSGSTTSLAPSALSTELPTSTSISPLPPTEVHQPVSFVTITDHVQLSTVPLPGETSTYGVASRTSVKAITEMKELKTEKKTLQSAHTSLDKFSDDIAVPKKHLMKALVDLVTTNHPFHPHLLVHRQQIGKRQLTSQKHLFQRLK